MSAMMKRSTTAFGSAQPRSTAAALAPRPQALRPSASAAARCTAAAPSSLRSAVRLMAASTEAASAVAAEPVVQAAVPVAAQDAHAGSAAAAELSSVVASEEIAELELAELDAEQEQLLSWMVNHSEEEQEQEMDEMVDYDEYVDDEYAELYSEVENMMEGSYSDVRVGDKVLGKVYEVDEEGAYVEMGEKASGFVPVAECSFAKLKTPLEALRVGMVREFVVVDREDENGQMVLSLAVLEASVMWLRMQQMQQEEVTVRVRVESANRGGLLVRYGPFDGFVPVGQFGPQITVENMESLVGQEIPVQFIEVNEESERLVFSNKRASGVAAGNTQNYKIGDVVLGEVQQVKPYGVFVDIGGMTGLLHVSQVSNQRITSVDKIFHEGDKLKVMILSMDRERGRITLSTKKLEPSPGDMLRDPQLVFEKADEMAALFRERMEAAAAQLAPDSMGMQQQLTPV